ncbi:MAG: IS30 family transposase, partial [Clostridia bacterium]
LTQDLIAKLFDKDQSGISRHIKNIFETRELDEKSNMQKMHFPKDKKMRISFKTIYIMIYNGDFENITKKNLRRKGKKVYYRQTSKRGKIPNAIPMSKRPKSIDKRKHVGDWEIDTVKGKQSTKACVASFADRKSRLYVAVKMNDGKANSFLAAAKGRFKEIAKGKIRSFNADNGSEFSKHEELTKTFKAKVYFARPHAPWDKPTNENHNGLLREFFPKKTDFTEVTQKELDEACELINNRPRKCLKWKTAREIFNKAI